MKQGLICTAVIFAGVLGNCAGAETGGKLLMGDVPDGSRAIPIHVIELLNENGEKMAATDELMLPFSTQKTCGACHSYDIVKSGWHFNAMDSNIPAGRPGQPWVFVDARTGTQIPVSYRHWPNVFSPEQVGLSPWKVTKLFGRQMPGGGPGDAQSSNQDEITRGLISGKLEINCLACHDGSSAHNQSQYSTQISRENFRWAAAATCGFARVSGSARDMPDTYDPMMPGAENVKNPPKIQYLADTFDPKGNVFFDIRRRAFAERCYFCHSTAQVGKGSPEKFEADEDVHLTSGITCIDCHRNKVDHNIVRGYQGEEAFSKNPVADDFSCTGCHLPRKGQVPQVGRLGSPVPKHTGLPVIHFQKLTCTACHSGLWPGNESVRVKTSMAHGLGTYETDKSADALPHIATVVFAKGEDDKIAPNNLIWPAFWATLKDDKVAPLDPEMVKPVIEQVMEGKKKQDGWVKFTDEQVVKILAALVAEKIADGKAVYICGGKMHSVGVDGKLVAVEHVAASACLWPVGHDVRPAAQSLGIGGCDDCHALGKPFFFGKVAVDSPIASEAGFADMLKFEKLDFVYAKVFALSLNFFVCVVVMAVVSSIVLTMVLVLYAFRGLARALKTFAGRK